MKGFDQACPSRKIEERVLQTVTTLRDVCLVWGVFLLCFISFSGSVSSA